MAWAAAIALRARFPSPAPATFWQVSNRILAMAGSSPAVVGNTAGHQAELLACLGERALFGFPAAGGVRDGPVIKYVLIRQQKTARLAADSRTLRSMVLAIRQAFTALRGAGNAEIPANLRVLFLCLPTAFAVAYWRRVFASPRGELWFGAHTRAAPDEMRSVAHELQEVLRRTGHPTPDLDGAADRLHLNRPGLSLRATYRMKTGYKPI